MRLIEKMTFSGAEFVEEAGAKVVKNVVLLGPVSSHGYEYTQEAMQKAVGGGLYEGCRIFINHDDGKGGRDLMHLAGVFKSTRHEAGKIKGDAHLLPDEYGLKFFNIAKTMPEAAGCSHVAEGKLVKGADGKQRIEQITKVHSVDLVVQGATTRSVFEGDTPNEPSVPRPRPDEKQYQFIPRCIAEVKSANASVTDEQAGAMCFTSWQARFESDGMDLSPAPAATSKPTGKEATNNNQSEGVETPRKESTMKTFSERIDQIVDDAEDAVERAARVVLPCARDAVRAEVQAETDREHEKQRATRPTVEQINEAAASATGNRETDQQFEERRQNAQTLREQNAAQAAEVAGMVTLD